MSVNYIRYIALFAVCCSGSLIIRAQDTTRSLEKVIVTSQQSRNSFTEAIPTQILSKDVLRNLNAATVGDAARFFSGVQVKDYGGAGGLKTISVRSLGASHTGILYDGIPVSDAQTGQIDLGRFSSSFLQSIILYQGYANGNTLPAKAFASASVLAITTISGLAASMNKKALWQAGIKTGSYAYNQANAGATLPLPGNFLLGLNAEFTDSRGNYPFVLKNGNIVESYNRNNSKIRSEQAEINILKFFRDSSSVQVKGWLYNSKRGLPSAIIFFNQRSKQTLNNEDYFIQSRYRKKINSVTSFQILTKFNHSGTRYRDPDFLNNNGGLDEIYKQNEIYFSASADRRLRKFFTASLASDISRTNLQANKKNFAEPTRISTWNNALIYYNDSLWQAGASLLWNHFSDRTKIGTAAANKNKFTPTVSLSRKIHSGSPIMIRAFYKEVFRMPTFNDLYYNFIGNTKLRPEYARQYNLGLTFSRTYNSRLKSMSLSVDGYTNKVKDKIIAVPGQNLFSFTMLNLGEVRIKGFDVNAETRGFIFNDIQWYVRVAYTWQQAQDYTDAQSTVFKNRIPYTPDHSGSAMASLTYQRWDAGYSVTFSGTRYTLGENNPFNQLNGWGTQDFFLQHNFSLANNNLSLKGEINNLSDTRYDVVRYYPMPGRTFKISILFNNL